MPAGGRNEIIIDWEKVDQFLMAGCTGTEVAAYFGCHPDTLYNKCKEKFQMGFSQYCQQKRSKGDNLLKNAQYKNALGGNTSMQIWLGKQRLGQKEPKNEDVNVLDLRQLALALKNIEGLPDSEEPKRSELEIE